jgi:hypothetical protein
MYHAGALVELDTRAYDMSQFRTVLDYEVLLDAQETGAAIVEDTKEPVAAAPWFDAQGLPISAPVSTHEQRWSLDDLQTGYKTQRADLLLYEESVYLKDRRAREVPSAYQVSVQDSRMSAFSMGHERLELTYQLLDSFEGKARTPDQKRVHAEIIKCAAPHIFGEDYNSARLGLLKQWGITAPHMSVMMLTPRRWGKTTSVSMIAAVMLYICPFIRITIFSTTQHMASMLLSDVRVCLMQLPGIQDRMKQGITIDNKKEISIMGYGHTIADVDAPQSAVRARMATVHGTSPICLFTGGRGERGGDRSITGTYYTYVVLLWFFVFGGLESVFLRQGAVENKRTVIRRAA